MESVLSVGLDALEARLMRNGYNVKVLAEMAGTKGTRPCSVAGRIGVGERSWTTPSDPSDGSKNGGTSVITSRSLQGTMKG